MTPDTREKINIVIEKPPVWDSVCTAFGIIPETAVFTYGDTIYNPGDMNLPDHIIVHEKVHMEQQNHNDNDAAIWWGKFLRDIPFRIDQEAHAYAKQYAFICSQIKGKEQRFKVRMELARIFAGPLYGNCITMIAAGELIRKLSGVK